MSLQGVACTLQVERLQRKFATIHSTLAQQQNNKPGPDTPRMSSLAHMHAENISKVRQPGTAVQMMWLLLLKRLPGCSMACCLCCAPPPPMPLSSSAFLPLKAITALQQICQDAVLCRRQVHCMCAGERHTVTNNIDAEHDWHDSALH